VVVVLPRQCSCCSAVLAWGMLVRERRAESGERGAGIGERGFAIVDLFILNGRKKMKI